MSDDAIENNDAGNYNININKTKISKSFEYETKLTGRMPDNNIRLDSEYVVPLKHLSRFWRSLNLLLIICGIEFDLTWSKSSVISEISRTPEIGRNNVADATSTTGATFKVNSAELYVPVVTLPINDSIKFSENIKQGFKIIIPWSIYRCETIVTQPKNKNLDYMINPTFWNINRLFMLSNNLERNSYDKHHMTLAKIKDFIILIDIDQPVKSKQEAYENLVEI